MHGSRGGSAAMHGRLCEGQNVRPVSEATNHLEVGKLVNRVLNRKRLMEWTERDNTGIQPSLTGHGVLALG